MFTVLKPFPHPTRRFVVGDAVTETDLTASTIDLADLKKRKFIAGAETKAAEAAVEKADTPVEQAAPPSPPTPKSRSALG